MRRQETARRRAVLAVVGPAAGVAGAAGRAAVADEEAKAVGEAAARVVARAAGAVPERVRVDATETGVLAAMGVAVRAEVARVVTWSRT